MVMFCFSVSCMIQTVMVCYLRASMVFGVSPQLWDDLLSVLSSLTQWKEVVNQWKVSWFFKSC